MRPVPREKVEEYRSRAEECVQLAQRASACERPILLQIAQTWLRLADLTKAEREMMHGDGNANGSFNLKSASRSEL